MIVTHLHSIFFCLFLSFPMFLFFLSFLFPVLFCLWVVCLLPSGLFAGFLYFVVCVDLFPDSGLEFLDLKFASPGYPSLLATFLLFLCFSLFLCLSFWFTVDFLFFLFVFVFAIALSHYSYCKTLHLKCLTVPRIRLCFDNCSVISTVTLCYVLHQTHSESWHI